MDSEQPPKPVAPRLSVVIASLDSSRAIAHCLDAISASCSGLGAELIVVQAGHEPAAVKAINSHQGVRLISLPEDSLTPRLWSEGLAISSGGVIAFTTCHCFVVRSWASEMLAAIDKGASGAGGPLRLERTASTLDAAIFFLRYSAFIERADNGPATDLAGDNSAYSRHDIPEDSWSRERGFWELEVNRAIQQAGGSLTWSNNAVAEFGRSFTFAAICHHRFTHGRIFGKARAADGTRSRMRIMLGSPLVPFVLAARAGRRVMPVPFYRLRFLMALPLILIIAGCWSAGEAAGAMES